MKRSFERIIPLGQSASKPPKRLKQDSTSVGKMTGPAIADWHSQTPRSRFTFDFVDEAANANPANNLANNVAPRTPVSSRHAAADLGFSPRRSARSPASCQPGDGAQTPLLSPARAERLDSKYSSRLPPSYFSAPSSLSAASHGVSPRIHSRPDLSSPSHHNLQTNKNSNTDSNDHTFNHISSIAPKMNRSLFQPPAPIQTNFDQDANQDANQDAAFMDESHDFGYSHASNTDQHHEIPRTPQRFKSHNTPSSSPRITANSPRPFLFASSPASSVRSLGSQRSANTSISAANSGCSTSFINATPNRRIMGISSPMSGALSSPSYQRNNDYSDRFIPSRACSNLSFSLPVNPTAEPNRSSSASNPFFSSQSSNDFTSLPTSQMSTAMPASPAIDQTPITTALSSEDASSSAEGSTERHDASNRQPLLYDALLRSELLGENLDPTMSLQASTTSSSAMGSSSPSHASSSRDNNRPSIPFRERSNNLRFLNPRQLHQNTIYRCGDNRASSVVNSFHLTPVSNSSNQRLHLGPYTERRKRKIPKVPFKVLDAPSLQDDFYLNLVDWSSLNFLAVGLGSCVYLWSACTSRVTKLCDLSSTEDGVTSVAWSEGGRHLAVGTTRGDVQLWDASAGKLVRTMEGHSARIGALSWKGSGGGLAGTGPTTLASGSRDRLIHLRDPRSDRPYEMRLCAHKQEVCGLKWSFDERSMLASGGNDNKLLVWDIKKHTQPVHTFADHTAAVKAIAWSPHQHGLLASGGGTADRCIRFWNCLTGTGINCIDTGSQVCNLAWSKNCNEIVSTHGYSLNQIVVWKYPTMNKMATLTGHTYRVLYLSVSPDGSTIVTGAGDETLRFWQVFPGPQSKESNSGGGLLFPSMTGSVIR